MMNQTSYWMSAGMLALAVIAPPPAVSQESRPVARPGVIDRPGSYHLIQDLRLNTSQGAGLTITASGVTLDLNGHEIMGPGGKFGTGVEIQGAEGVEVRNGSLSYLAFGVVVRDSANVKLKGMRIRGQGLPVVELPPEAGFMVVQSRNVVIEGNAIYNTGLGVFMRGGQTWGNRIANNTITAGTNGVLGICYNPTPTDANAPRGDLIYNNLITGFGTGMQFVPTSAANVIRENTIAFVTMNYENGNDTNQFVDNTSVQLP